MPTSRITIDPAEFARHWLNTTDMDIQPVSTGTNNATHRIRRGNQQFILRLTLDSGAKPRLLREMSLLGSLQRLQLPFHTPAPIRSRKGEWIVEAGTPETPVLATLFHAIEGTPVDRRNLNLTRQAGTALAILDRAVAKEPLDAVDPVISPGELRKFRLPEHPAISQNDASHTSTLMEAIADRWERIRSAFPAQIIHADYYPSNVLAQKETLTGIIDFELSLTGPRVLDLAIGLWTFGADVDGYTWPAIDAFAQGYSAIVPVSDAEIHAIPDLIAMREAGSLVHWSGRYALGLVDEGTFHWRIERLHQVHEMMARTGGSLVARVGKAVHGARTAGK